MKEFLRSTKNKAIPPRALVSLLIMLTAGLSTLYAQTTVTLTTSGSTWTVPTGVTSATFYIWGGGGGGGGGKTGTNWGNGGGGGGGACGVVTATVVPGAVYTASTIGAGGAGGAGSTGSNGSNGGTTTFSGGAVTWTVAGGTGGTGSSGSTNGVFSGGAGGSTVTGAGITGHSGGTGSGGNDGTGVTGTGGGAGGSGAAGTSPASSCGVSGAGGTGTYTGGNGGYNGSCSGHTNNSGSVGAVPGGGGSGDNAWSSNSSGSAGGAGEVIIVYTGVPSITSFTPASGCSGSLPLVTITGVNLSNTTSVKFNGTAAASFTNVNATTVTATPASGSGTGLITLTTAGGTATSLTSFTVNTTPTASVTASGPTTFCAGDSVSLTASGGGTYSWNTGPGTAIISAKPAATTNYIVTVTAASGGCTSTASMTVTINPLPTAVVTVTSGCPGGLSKLTASGGSTYHWSNTSTTASITSSSVASYQVTVTSAAGCSATASGTSSFYTSNPSVTLSSNTPVCVGAAIDLTASPSSGASPYTYSWSGPASYTSTSSAPTITNSLSADSGTYDLTVTDNNGCTVAGNTSVLVDANCVDSTTVGVNGAGSSYAPCTQILRFDHYNSVVAATSGGQDHTWILQNGNILTMNIKCVAGGFYSVVAPSWSGSAFGETGYTGLSGKTVLYTNGSGWSKLVFSNILLKDSLGNRINNFTLIGIDGESTDNAERDTIISNGTSWYDYDTINPPPTVGSIPTETGIGTSNLVWTGNGPSNARARLVSTNDPTYFTFSTVAGGLQGFAMGLSNPVTAPDSVTICSGGTFSATPTNLPHGTTYSWSAPVITPAGSITGGSAVSGASTVGQALVNTTTSPATAVYNVIPSNTCSGLGYSVTVIVQGSFSATVSPGTPQCAGNTIIVSAVPNAGGTYTYKWSGPESFTATGDSFTIASSTLANGGTYTITMTSSNTCTATASGVLTVKNCVSASGWIFDDANGDGIIDGTDFKGSLGQTLYSVLYDTSGKVVATGAISAGGAFSMGQMLPNTPGFHMYVSTSDPAVGSTATGYSWPSGWVSTLGQFGINNEAGTGVDHAGSELVEISTDTSNITNILIGYDRVPSTDTQTYIIGYSHYNAIKNLTPANGMGYLAGTDPEDGGYSTGSTFTITSLAGMNGNELFYVTDGDSVPQPWQQITGYTTITNYNPNDLYVKFVGAASMSASFTYGATDAAGVTDPAPSTYTIFWAGTLPVKMLYFNASRMNSSESLLSWATASEQDNAYFDVERSADAQVWQQIGRIKGAGTTAQQTNYSMVDEEPLQGVNYYQLRQVNVDGVASYSEIAAVVFDTASAANTLLLYPNPVNASEPFTIGLSDRLSVIEKISITNTMGENLYQNDAMQGNSTQISGLALPAGIYTLSIMSDGRRLTSMLVIR